MQIFHHGIKSYLPEFVYGSIDGTVTTFAIIAGIAGADLSSSIVLILGFSNVLADGFSMASSNYLSEESHQAQVEGNHTAPWKTAFATFISFITIGSMPLVAYVISYLYPGSISDEFRVASILTLLTFFFIGLVRGKVADTSLFKAALQTCFIGLVAALVAYGVGAWLKGLV